MKRSLLIFVWLALLMVSCVSTKHNKEMKTERLTYFSYESHNAMAMIGERYDISITPEGRVRVVIDQDRPSQKELYLDDTAIMDQLQDIVKKYKMDEYKENYQPEMDIYDGTSWSLYYQYDSGHSVRSGGYEAWPENYREMQQALTACFHQWCDQENK